VANPVRSEVGPGQEGARLLEAAHREVADADVTDPTRTVEGLEGLHRLAQRDLAPWIRPVYLIEVNLPHAEPLQARGTRLFHVVRAKMPPADLRRDEDPVPTEVLDRPRHDLLRMPIAVRLRGVHE